MNSSNPFVGQPETTGKYLVLLSKDEVDAGIQSLTDSAGISSVTRAADFEAHALSGQQLESAENLVFDNLGVAVVTLDAEQLQSVGAAIADESQPIYAVEPERIVYALSDVGLGKLTPPTSGCNANIAVEYLKGYRDGVAQLIEKLIATDKTVQTLEIESEETATWGLQATKVIDSRYSGRGIKVAVLDTGLDLNHPDFAGRKIVSKSFISGQQVQDQNGHGTHCIGTACGSLSPTIVPRYGVAYEAEIYAGKVLSNQGSGSDRSILAGIEWAVTNGCQIVSMSLGARTFPGDSFSRVYETLAKRALEKGTLIIAAAGNDSRRPGTVAPVSHPANCPSIMAVAALNSQHEVAWFSCGGLNPDGGHVDIAGPGVDVYSTWPMAKKYNTISGTSMATPHVAGIAALYAEATGATGQALWNLLTQHALRLPLPSVDVGIGLVQAPSDAS
ncbi:MAG TPA: protease [Cyanobacteria bacterium UBA11369]|nr:protease [Cyanobacteria bacterium UBA11371]HBE31455.1 protease [Cyanobacteria bacterium UBA11368]HBE52731.1 protease [Cyanobacteria bacterium UBA11369]